MLYTYSFFHLNIAYSAVETDRRRELINKCYWPLLELYRDLKSPIGIELSGYSLEEINRIDPEWVNEFKVLLKQGICELIGSGYTQIIGPLVPAALVLKNLHIGNQIYKKYLDVKPNLALVNEQVYSAGLVENYINAGYEAIIMEWNNPYSWNEEWDRNWKYFPQIAKGTSDNLIPVIWNNSINFQKFQRYVHGETNLDYYISKFGEEITSDHRAYPLYGSDAETFNFRPGRYLTEREIHPKGEWKRIRSLLETLEGEDRVTAILPSKVLDINDSKYSNNVLSLESIENPIPVKKQQKYNVNRWAVTGINDTKINTICHRILAEIKNNSSSTDADWKELCYLWTSDFRTHITRKRWRAFNRRLNRAAARYIPPPSKIKLPELTKNKNRLLNVDNEDRYVTVNSDRLSIVFDKYKGLSIAEYSDKSVSTNPIFGTIPHGFFENIKYGADFFSGHLVFQEPTKHKITDLVPCFAKVSYCCDKVKVSTFIENEILKINKNWAINAKTNRLQLNYKIKPKRLVKGSLRLAYITLMPNNLDTSNLSIRCHNGGKDLETFKVDRKSIDYGRAVSSLISSNQALGITEGILKLSDGHKVIQATCDHQLCYSVAQFENNFVDNSVLSRACFSLKEFDDTSTLIDNPLEYLNFSLNIESYLIKENV